MASLANLTEVTHIIEAVFILIVFHRSSVLFINVAMINFDLIMFKMLTHLCMLALNIATVAALETVRLFQTSSREVFTPGICTQCIAMCMV